MSSATPHSTTPEILDASATAVNSSTPPLHKIRSRHVHIDDGNNLRERQWSTPGSGRPTRPPMVRSPSGYSAKSGYSRAQSSGTRTPIDPYSPRASISTFHLQHLLESLEMDQYDTFGIEELRDGFFDATFYRSTTHQDSDDDDEEEEDGEAMFGVNLGKLFRKKLRAQLEDTKFFFTATFGTRDGILLAKSFLGYFIAYILCLIPKTRTVLGDYSYWVTIAALFNHAGRTAGAQIDGTVGCIVGGALGLAVGTLALEVASSTAVSRAAYGGVLAAFVVPILAIIGWIRCSFLRLYQALITAGLALIFLCLVGTESIDQTGKWRRSMVQEFAIPWLIGLGISLVVNLCLYPETGGRAVATALHNAIDSALKALELPRPYSLEVHSNMSKQIVKLSDAVRDMRNEITFTSLRPADVDQLRILLQSVIRHIMAIKPGTSLFIHEHQHQTPTVGSNSASSHDIVIQIDPNNSLDDISIASSYENPLEIVRNTMAGPSRALIDAMAKTLHCCDNALMRIAGLSDLFDRDESSDVQSQQAELRSAMQRFDEADVSLMEHPDLPSSYSSHPDLVELFLFINPLRQSAAAVDSLATKVLQISQDPKSKSKRLFLPSYPLSKALYRANPQVLHDRGGASAGYYFRIKDEISNLMEKIHARPYEPDALASNGLKNGVKTVGIGGSEDGRTLRYRIWKVLHRLQQFETRFAVKVILVCGALSVPAWLNQSRGWWAEKDSWWAVVAAWIMMHPRVGGNAQDLVTRTIATLLGAVWGGLAAAAARAAGSASPYVLAVFAAIFMIPAVFRFMLSAHPRSGLMACLSFTVVSLSGRNHSGGHSPVEIAWSRGVALSTGVVAAVIVNWVVWPFVARHELRKSLSYMLLNLGIAYRGVIYLPRFRLCSHKR
ncbi:hypothetical protein FN846DRAFT_627486 [Sphaerosporella brunnea]|uniref:Uncharacterized protein n=1 Tax=Sphaerosporella brunnea TaxID=1250544 RepID=A0A5J5F103_9PEZI|nr:hypothetical protein FN846DRAFT_627486 [Sphaerosporella brunnea]